ncbi:hypothetical protein BDU57DRAFT_518333 [Ampelomyces quisqualis]|uniref:Uncharacterized protein n=1 Tax=Ampelomyces quisqualis TaxID=50730 RepID=A0A6A5QJ02_AMPQU|nr:hypothetical protein BDU57DRAFT_518333 [Ampelomyces quisqualis]
MSGAGNNKDPLAGWRRENLAAPKRPQGQARNAPATQYDDDSPTPASPRAPIPPLPPPPPPPQPRFANRRSRNIPPPPPNVNRQVSRNPLHPPSPPPAQPPAGDRGLPTRGRPPSRVKKPYQSPSSSPGPQTANRGRPTRGRPPSRVRKPYRSPSLSPDPHHEHRGQTTRGRTPSKVRKPFQSSSSSPSRSPVQSRNTGPQNAQGKKRVLTEAERSECPFGDTRWPPLGEYTRPLHLICEDKGVKKRIYYHLVYDNLAHEAREWQRETDAKAAEATSKIPSEEASQITIMNAFNGKKLRVISEGERGKIWILDEGCEEVWAMMRSMKEERGAVRVTMAWEAFEVFGVGVKAHLGDVLLVSWPFPAEKVRVPA